MQKDGVVASALHVLAIEELGNAAAGTFTAAEQTYARSKSDAGRCLAARLAAKRVAGRLLGVPLGEIEVVLVRGGPSSLCLSPSAEARLQALGATRALVGLTHGGEHAAAAVLLLGPEA